MDSEGFIRLNHERLLLHDLERAARELDEVIAFEKLLTLRQIRIGVFLHDA